MQSLPVVIIRCEENEIYQLDFRIQTDNIRCFIILSGLRKVRLHKHEQTTIMDPLSKIKLRPYVHLQF
jgi:hypothetical protein